MAFFFLKKKGFLYCVIFWSVDFYPCFFKKWLNGLGEETFTLILFIYLWENSIYVQHMFELIQTFVEL